MNKDYIVQLIYVGETSFSQEGTYWEGQMGRAGSHDLKVHESCILGEKCSSLKRFVSNLAVDKAAFWIKK